ncbi:phosphate transporter PHO1-1 [Selaginella moellendorffii]|uniref:phosphate transporter PHO1-1 n=1 Tax=Selaginella moellendorffii TaxID=88036 RepID=UPI000D1C2BBB|nr:phosphate transporter PHO1-1 [Selaginella moellendorffii]|eukprot:XP_024540660.1 phosphate transporter PHO1-1 [Selaginella moellendorffii]
MVKFQKQLEGQLVPEWRVKYCDYKQLKKVVKRIKTQILHTKNQQHKVFDPNVFSVDKSKLENLLQNPSAILSSCCEQSISSETSMVVHKTRIGDGEDFYETELFGTRSDHEKSFFFGLDDQLNKVDNFFRCKEDEYDAQARQLHIQMEELIAMQDDESQSLKGSPGNKGKVQRAAKMLQTAFVEFYRGLRLLRNFSSLNMMAFVKIRKKYEKVTGVWQLPLCNVGR